MKKNLIKKVFAVSLSIAMACSFLPAANPVTASAAAPYVSLKTTFKTLKVNQKYKMTLKNNKISWKIKKVETTDKTIATVYGKTTSSVMIKGKSEGRATVRVHLKTTKRKANNTKTLRCRVKVVADSQVVTPTKTDAEVKTQAELDAALNDSNITKITVNPTTAEKFVIAQKSYPSVDLIVNAPLSDVDNSATFKSITINDIKPETWTERAAGNTIAILAKNARVILEQTASVKKLTYSAAGGKFNLEVKGGKVDAVEVTAKSEVNFKGTAATGAALIPVTFGAAATDSVFNTELPVAVRLNTTVELVFEAGAVKSTVKLEVAGIRAIITNRTTEPIVVTKNDNKTTETVRAGAVKSTVNAVTNTTTPVNPGTTNPGTTTTKPATNLKVITEGAIINVSGAVTGSSVVGTVSDGSITFNFTGLKTTVNTSSSIKADAKVADIQYTIRGIVDKTDTIKGYNYQIATGTIPVYRDTDTSATSYQRYVSPVKGTLKNVPMGATMKILITFNVAATDTTGAGQTTTMEGTVTIPSDGNGVVITGTTIRGAEAK